MSWPICSVGTLSSLPSTKKKNHLYLKQVIFPFGSVASPWWSIVAVISAQTIECLCKFIFVLYYTFWFWVTTASSFPLEEARCTTSLNIISSLCKNHSSTLKNYIFFSPLEQNSQETSLRLTLHFSLRFKPTRAGWLR